eukprot:6640277-Ditylum_brightwellii.AAC.1
MGHSRLNALFKMHFMSSAVGIVPSLIVSAVLGRVLAAGNSLEVFLNFMGATSSWVKVVPMGGGQAPTPPFDVV